MLYLNFMFYREYIYMSFLAAIVKYWLLYEYLTLNTKDEFSNILYDAIYLPSRKKIRIFKPPHTTFHKFHNNSTIFLFSESENSRIPLFFSGIWPSPFFFFENRRILDWSLLLPLLKFFDVVDVWRCFFIVIFR